MSGLLSANILDSVFVANPRYELVLFDRLPAEQREVLKDLCRDPGFYGILRPAEASGLGIKSVSQDTALLFLTLQQAGRLPDYVRTTLGERCNDEISKLVLDGVLALHRNDKFVSGAEAASFLYEGEDLPSAYVGKGFLGRLSVECLRYGQSLKLTDRMALSERLYGYNRIPLSVYWKAALPDETAASDFLGIRNDNIRVLLDREWVRVRPTEGNDGWFAWQSR